MNERDQIQLLQMRDCARKIVKFSEGQTRDIFDSDVMFRYALSAVVCIVGKLADRVSTQTRNINPQIKWSDFIKVGNHLLEEYYAVDRDRLWNTVIAEVPNLLNELENLIPPDEPQK